ncbi:MAG: transcription termination factor NusA [Candidatus Magasanikbacteria bacterium]|nr:transcription termination factor NusA [Candidatus Magasanikbacteria bacterium]
MASEIIKSIQFLCNEKGLEYETVMEALEFALAAAYRKDFGDKQQNIKVHFDPETGDMKVWDEKEVAEDYDLEELEKSQERLAELREIAHMERRELEEDEMEGLIRFNPKNQMMISEAKKIKKTAKLGDIIKIDLEIPGDFGRMAAQTAKQVIIQKIREAERNSVFEDFKNQEGDIVQGVIQRRDSRSGVVIIDLGKITGILPVVEQVQRERYIPGNRMTFFVQSVDMGNRGPEIILSRTNIKMVEVVFDKEIPEINTGEVVIKAIARDAGSRSKVAVFTKDESVDPIGSCIGQRGSRINTIIDELGGEKIDIIHFDEKVETFIKNSLAPAKIETVVLNEEEKTAAVNVKEDQLSLAIGRGGQNVRLATELTGWRIKVVQVDEEGGEVDEENKEESPNEKEVSTEEKVEEVKEETPVEEKAEEKTKEVVEEKVEGVKEETSEEVAEKKTEETKEEAPVEGKTEESKEEVEEIKEDK